MKRGEVWWVEFDPSVGTEVQKTRPAVIVSNDKANMYAPRVQVVPLTSKVFKKYVTEAYVSVNGKRSKAMADQMTTADKRRVLKFISTLTQKEMADIEETIKIQLALED